ncbi:MAG: MATE family efflux transporter [Peptococcaceae bacterium]|nr:MATE family efflux transporter [Peptococcaceae bacterium]
MDFLTADVGALYRKYLLASLGSAMVMSIYSFVDTIAVGQAVGPMGTAAIAVLNPFFSVMIFLAILCGIGGAVLMSNAKGEGLEARGNAYFTAALVLVGLVIVIGWPLFYIFHEQIFVFFGADAENLPYVLAYGKWLVLFYPMFVLPTFLGAFLRNDGAPGLATLGVVTGGLFNIFGDWYFCFPLGMGMEGAAIATVSGTTIQAAIMGTHFLRRGKCHLHLVWPKKLFADMRRIVTLGFGAGVLDLGNVLIAIIINNQIMRYGGVEALSVYGVVGTISLLFQALFCGVGQALQPLVSTNYGARQLQRVHQVYRLAFVTVMVMGVVFTLIGELFPTQITRLFIAATPEVLAIAPLVFRCYFPFFLFLGITVLATYYLQSIMHERQAMTISVLRSLLLPNGMLIALPLVLGLTGVFFAMPLSECCIAMLALVFIRRYGLQEK